jgi:hypothetical protein
MRAESGPEKKIWSAEQFKEDAVFARRVHSVQFSSAMALTGCFFNGTIQNSQFSILNPSSGHEPPSIWSSAPLAGTMQLESMGSAAASAAVRRALAPNPGMHPHTKQ